MKLNNSQEILGLKNGDIITKRNIYDLIQFSKIENSQYWSGSDNIIGNTPQQGINWIGTFPFVKGVIIKTRKGSYKEDGWNGDDKITYHYSFKAKEGIVSYEEKANKVLIKQPQYLYPVFLFTEIKDSWFFEGQFNVLEIEKLYVVLKRIGEFKPFQESMQDELQFDEGERQYVTHLMAERSKSVVSTLKDTKSWVCEICNVDFKEKYGISYIEAHHKIPISTYNSKHIIKLQDLALLCPNCHKAVHLHMKLYNKNYDEITHTLYLKSF
jgi:putative restriction endonuclease